jgi:hypothetical protein
LVVLGHRPVPADERQTHVSTGIEDAVAKPRELAGDKDVALIGGEIVTAALGAGLVDEVLLHQVPMLLGGRRSFFGDLPEHVAVNLLEVVPAPGVTTRGTRWSDEPGSRLQAVLDGTPIAHLATVLPDGAPHSVPVWSGTHGWTAPRAGQLSMRSRTSTPVGPTVANRNGSWP